MPRRNVPPIDDDRGWLITPRALTSLATVVGLVYTLHAPVRYVLQLGATVDALSARVAALEIERDRLDHGNTVLSESSLRTRPGAPVLTPPAPTTRSWRSTAGPATDPAPPMTLTPFFLP